MPETPTGGPGGSFGGSIPGYGETGHNRDSDSRDRLVLEAEARQSFVGTDLLAKGPDCPSPLVSSFSKFFPISDQK